MHNIGRVVSVSYEKLIFEVSDFEKLSYNLNGNYYFTKGVIDYVTIVNRFKEKFIYQVIKVEDKEIILSSEDLSKFNYIGKFECVPIGIINNNKIEYNMNKYPFLQDKVYLTSDEELKIMFYGRNKVNSINLGLIDDKYNAYIDLNKFFTNHSAILGNTGSGKSNTVRRIISEVNKNKLRNMRLHIFDIHNEYSKISCVNTVNVLENFKINIKDLELQDWMNLVKPSELVQVPVIQLSLKIAYCIENNLVNENSLKCFIAKNLYFGQQTDTVSKRAKIIGVLQNTDIDIGKYNSKFGNFEKKDEEDFINDLDKGMENLTDDLELNNIIERAQYNISSFESLLNGMNYVFLLEEAKGNSQARAYSGTLETRIKNIKIRFSKLFSDNNTEINDKVIVYNVSELDDDLLLFFTSYVLKKELNLSQRNTLENKNINVFIFEEAHRYISKTKEDSKFHEVEIFKKIAREGRKFGCFLVISSQRPSELSSTILSQCNNYIIHRIKNNHDLDYLLNTIPFINKAQLSRFSYLPTGKAFIVGELFELPVEIKVHEDANGDNSKTPMLIFNDI